MVSHNLVTRIIIRLMVIMEHIIMERKIIKVMVITHITMGRMIIKAMVIKLMGLIINYFNEQFI